MKFWVGVTDNRWFSFLSQTGVDEVNFWQPRGHVEMRELQAGAPFLFKVKKPHNHIAGCATFVKSSTLPLSMAWDIFGQKNGAATRADFERMIRPLLENPMERNPQIGCLVLTSPEFWQMDHWISEPIGWSNNIVRGKYYDTTDPIGNQLWLAVRERMLSSQRSLISEESNRYGAPTWVQPRLGQSAFRVVVTDAYQRRCAITGENTLPVLEAAHIKPYADNGPHDVRNGLLLRSDFHILFDEGLVTVTPDYRIEVSPKIRETWFNGKSYYRLHGEKLAVMPGNREHLPHKEFLDWHNSEKFQR